MNNSDSVRKYINYSLLILASLGACKRPNQDPTSSVKDVVASRDDKNLAIIIGSAGKGVPLHTDPDISNMQTMAKELFFEPVVLNNKPFEQWVQKPGFFSNRLAKLSENSTILLYYTGHSGVLNGEFGLSLPSNASRADAFVPLQLILDRLGSDLKSKSLNRIKRLVIILDSCQSSAASSAIQSEKKTTQAIQHVTAIESKDEKKYRDWDFLTFQDAAKGIAAAIKNPFINQSGKLVNNRFFEQLLIFSAAGADQSAQDGVDGGRFTLSLVNALEDLKRQKAIGNLIQEDETKAPKSNIRIIQWLELTIEKVKEYNKIMGGDQVPVYDGIDVDTIMGDLLFQKNDLASKIEVKQLLDCEKLQIPEEDKLEEKDFTFKPYSSTSTVMIDQKPNYNLSADLVYLQDSNTVSRIQCFDRKLNSFKMIYYMSGQEVQPARSFMKLSFRYEAATLARTNIVFDYLDYSEHDMIYYATADASLKTKSFRPLWKDEVFTMQGWRVAVVYVPISWRNFLFNFQLCFDESNCQALSQPNSSIAFGFQNHKVRFEKLPSPSEFNTKFDPRLKCEISSGNQMASCKGSTIPILTIDTSGQVIHLE